MGEYEILFVDEDLHIAEAIAWAFEKKGYGVDVASSSEEAIEALSTRDFDLVITDHLDIAKKARDLDPEAMVIISTDNYEVAFAINALQLDAYNYILKPFDLVELWNQVNRCIDRLELRRSAAQNVSKTRTSVERFWS